MIPWFCIKLEILTVCSTCGSFTCKDQLGYLCSTPWVGILDAQMLLSSGRYGLPEGLVWSSRYRWPFVFWDELLARWQRLAFGVRGVLFFLSLVLQWLEPTSSHESDGLSRRASSRRFRKSLWTGRIHFSAVGSNLDDTIWFFLVYLPYFWG